MVSRVDGKDLSQVKRADKLLFLLTLALTFTVILGLNLLTPMVADDYRYAFSFSTGARLQSPLDIFPSLAAHASVMNGRLVPHFFVQLFTLMPRPVFSVINALVYMALLLGLYLVVKKTETRFNWRLLLILDGAVFLLPSTFGQSFLWLSGSLNYLWCDALMVWVLLPFANLTIRLRNIKAPWQWALLTVGSLLLGNMSENVSATAALIMGLCVCLQLARHRTPPMWMVVSALMTLIGWSLLMIAPANRANVGQAVQGINAIFEHFKVALAMWMQNGLWLSMVFLALFFFAAICADADRNRLIFAMLLFVGSLVCNFMMAAAGYYPERAFTGSILMVILAIAVLLPAVADVSWGKALVHSFACGLALVMALQMLNALPNAYNRYRQAQARVAEVTQARDSGTLNVVTFGIKGNSRYDAFDGLNELTDDPTYFPNVYFAKYYGLQSVIVDRFE